MKNKEYTIETLSDIFNAVTKNNVEVFLADLSTLVRIYAGIKEDMPEELLKDLAVKNYIWVDDNKHEVELRLIEKDEKV